ncbi:hypothetical protein AVEN_258665-1 [Araneus ventricosus]|uniref:Uncharacterized protein n=1 Tax=Araneus ventricosus TaxID=182803 RepID=A0A4Y2E8A0_ARAVE|nr:hypothetical protein AVEN_258665-1 [Araneus ventricosus]
MLMLKSCVLEFPCEFSSETEETQRVGDGILERTLGCEEVGDLMQDGGCAGTVVDLMVSFTVKSCVVNGELEIKGSLFATVKELEVNGDDCKVSSCLEDEGEDEARAIVASIALVSSWSKGERVLPPLLDF